MSNKILTMEAIAVVTAGSKRHTYQQMPSMAAVAAGSTRQAVHEMPPILAAGSTRNAAHEIPATEEVDAVAAGSASVVAMEVANEAAG